MVRFAQIKIRREKIPSLGEVEEARATVFFEKLRGGLDEGKFTRHDPMIDQLLELGYASTDICSALIHLLQGGAGAGGPEKGASSPSPSLSPSPAPERKAHAHAKAPAEPAEPAREKFTRETRTGTEPGMTTLFFNVGRKHLVTAADVVGKIAGVTRLPASVVGAIDIHQRHSLVDVAEAEAGLILKKLQGIRIRGEILKPAPAAGLKLEAD